GPAGTIPWRPSTAPTVGNARSKKADSSATGTTPRTTAVVATGSSTICGSVPVLMPCRPPPPGRLIAPRGRGFRRPCGGVRVERPHDDTADGRARHRSHRSTRFGRRPAGVPHPPVRGARPAAGRGPRGHAGPPPHRVDVRRRPGDPPRLGALRGHRRRRGRLL